VVEPGDVVAQLRSVQACLGHARIATTTAYLAIATDALVAEYQRVCGGAPAPAGAVGGGR